MPTPFELALLIIFPAAMAYALAMDLLTMTIPNRVSLALLAGFLVLAPLMGFGLGTIGLHLAIGAAMLCVGFALFALGWIGGGDAKLFAATALWLGPTAVLEYGLIAALLGGLLTIAILTLRSLPLPAGLARQAWLARLHDTREGVPYGIALAVAGLLVYPHTHWMTGVAG